MNLKSVPNKDFLITLAATTWWYVHIWRVNYEEFSTADGYGFFLHCTALLALEYLVLNTVCKVWSVRGSLIVNALFCTFNFYTGVLLYAQYVATLTRVYAILLMVSLVGIFCLVFLAGRKTPFNYRAVLLTIGVLAVLNIGDFGWKQFERRQALENVPLPPGLSYPSFSKTPNVYFVFFDAMIPQSIAERFLKVDQELEYVTVLRDEGFRILKNVFADDAPTLASFNAFVALDVKHFKSIQWPLRSLHAIGAIRAALYEVFKRNGYKIQLTAPSTYFGRLNEAKLDYYGVANVQGLCDHVDLKYALMGYCLPPIQKVWSRVLGSTSQPNVELVVRRIKKIASASEPWLTVTYIIKPGHTPMDFDPYSPDDWAAYASRFRDELSKLATEHLRTLLTTIRENDPNAIVVVLGDHGAWLSRGLLSKKKIPDDSPLSETEVFLDRHAVVGAIFPANFCDDYFPNPTGIAHVARSVIKCLADGQDPLPSDYQPEREKYKRYAYE